MLPLRTPLPAAALTAALLLAAAAAAAPSQPRLPLGEALLAGPGPPLAMSAVPSEGWPPSSFDPLLVHYPADDCDTGRLEVQQWSRIALAWEAHPSHPVLQGSSCQVEDAGGLLNEIRIRCLDPTGRSRPSPWRVGAAVWQPPGENPCPLGGEALESPGPLTIDVSSPAPGARLRDASARTPVRGRVHVGGPAPPRYEIFLALDASQPEGDGPHAGALLEAQRRAATRLLDALAGSLGRVRLGLLSFSGPPGPPGDGAAAVAQLELPLSSDAATIAAALQAIAPGAPAHGEAFPAALELAVAELTGGPGTRSRPRRDTRKLLLMLCDGGPALPFGEGDRDRGHWDRTLQAADRARGADIALHLFALGGRGTPFSPLAHEMLQGTPGSFARISDPRGHSDWLEGFSFGHVERVTIDNLTTDEPSEPVMLTPDGRFAGLLPVHEGRNRVRVTALASDGRQQSVEFELLYDRPPDAAERFLEAERQRMERVRRARSAPRRGLRVEVEGP